MTNPRAVAAVIVEQVCYQSVSLSEAFDDTLAFIDDIPLIKEMCFGTLRYWISLQAILKDLLETPLKQKDKDIECLLCVGLYQLIHMKVPDYALVNETVTATRVLQKAWASKLVNKILRLAIEKKSNAELTTRGITAHYAHPNWIIEKIQSAWPHQFENILAANNQKAPLFLRVNETRITMTKFKKLLSDNDIDYESVSGLSHGIVLTQAMPVEKIPGFLEGFFSVQDASGQKVAEYLDLKPNQIILDACAAPGSKTTHMLEMCPDIQKLVAIDIDRNRLSRVKDNVQRLKLSKKNVVLKVADILDTAMWWDDTLFDRILVDAPCSASGVIRRHPDIKLLRKKTDIPTLAAQQLHILSTLWPLLKADGKLLYSTCSIFTDENEAVIEKLLSLHPDATILPINNDWGTSLKYGQQVLTGDRDRDGFYYALVQKNI